MMSHFTFASEATSEPDFWVLTALEPPFSARNERGHLEGYVIEVVKGILAQAHIKQEILAGPWERIIDEAQSKENVLLFPLARTPEREDDFHWILPLTANVYGILGEQKEQGTIESLDQVSGFTPIGVLDKDFRHQVLKSANIGNIKAYETYDSAVTDLVTGNLRTLFFSDGGLRYFCFKLGHSCSHISLMYRYDTLTSYIALSKRSDKRHVTNIKHAAARFLQSEAFRAIQQRWLVKLQAQGPFKFHIKDDVLNLW